MILKYALDGFIQCILLKDLQGRSSGCSQGVWTCVRELSVEGPGSCIYPALIPPHIVSDFFVWQATIFGIKTEEKRQLRPHNTHMLNPLWKQVWRTGKKKQICP